MVLIRLPGFCMHNFFVTSCLKIRLLALLLLVLLLSGCANNPFMEFVYSDTEDTDENLHQVTDTTVVEPELMVPETPALKVVKIEDKPTLAATATVTAPVDIWQRIQHGRQLTEIQHSRIDKEIDRFYQHPSTLYALLKRAEPYLFFITEELEKRQMPMEIALLPAVESGFQPFAYSPDGAVGLWQFMPATGRIYGLKEDWWQDGRRDIVASTQAALDMLQALHKRFDGDWLKALAAYNAGAGKINSAIRKNRKKALSTSYWDLDLPRETDNYIPRLLALSKLVAQAPGYQLALPEIANKAYFDSVDIGQQIDLHIAAKLIGMDSQALLKLNSHLTRWASSPQGPHRLLVPVAQVTSELENTLVNLPNDKRLRWKRHKIKQGETLSHIALKYDVAVKAIKQSNQLKNNNIRAGKNLLIPLSESVTQLAMRGHRYTPKSRIRYKVRGGDSLYRIARKFNVKIADLRKWNNLSKGYIQPGQKLTVYPVRKTL